LAAAEREAFRTQEVSPATRILAVVTGTAGLLAVGILVLTAAPKGQDSPIAVGATTTPAAVEVVRRSGIAAIGRFASDDDQDVDTPTPARVAPALATPVGDGRSAVMTRLSAAGTEGDALDVRLTSGPVVTASILTDDDDVVVVTIEQDDPGHEIASKVPGPEEIVTVLADPPVTVAFADVDSVGAAEGTPVLDGNGQLVGLCTRGADGTTGIVDVTTQPAGGETPPSTAPPSGVPVSDAPAAATSAAP
jgi:hypothetical protein